MTQLKPLLIAVACAALAPQLLADEAADRAFVAALSKTLERKAVEVELRGREPVKAKAEGASPSDTDSFEDDADDYWEDGEDEAPKPADTGKRVTGILVAYEGLAVERIQFPKAEAASEYAAAFGAPEAFSDPLVMQQRGAFVVVAVGRELKDPKRALELFKAAWAHSPGKGAAVNRYALLPHVVEARSMELTSTLSLMEFDQFEGYLARELPDAHVQRTPGKGSVWLAHDPNLSAEAEAYAKAILELPNGWRKAKR